MTKSPRPTGDYNPLWDLPPYMSQGSAHNVSSDPAEPDIVEQLYDAVEDATGKDLRPRRRGIGFI